MGTLFQDLRYAFRTLSKSPGFAIVAVLTLALGIGANTALFSIVNGVLLNPLPYQNADQIVTVTDKTSDFPEGAISYPNFLDWARENNSFASLAAYRPASFNLIGDTESQRVTGMEVSASFFPLLGVNPVIGRNFSSAEDQLNGPPSVILSGGFWKAKFGSSPKIIGRALNLNGTDYTVIGVIPENFYFCCEAIHFHLSDVYVTLGASMVPVMRDRKVHPEIFAIGRIKPGVTLRQARDDMDRVARSLAVAYPDADKDRGITVMPLKQEMVKDIQPFLLVLFAAVGFVLLIACVNVANLLLARSTGRAREFAIRAALGASQGRVIRQLLTESVLLALAGGGLGLLLASWGTSAGLSLLPSALPRTGDVRIDVRVLLFTLAVSFLAGILFGFAPALKTSHPDLHEALKEGGRGAGGTRYRTQGIFVIVEMALAVVLLAGAGLTIRTLVDLWSVNPGFDRHNVFSFSVGLPPLIGKADPAEIRAAVQQLTNKIAAVPGVRAVSLMNGGFPLKEESDLRFWIDGRPKPATESNMPDTLFYIVGADYLKVMKIPLLRGRFFTAQDDEKSPLVCVVDKNFSQKLFGNEDPIGRRIHIAVIDKQLEIVGVVGHTLQFGLDEGGANSPAQTQLYFAAVQLPGLMTRPFSSTARFIVRAEDPPRAFLGAARVAVREFNTKAVFFESETMDYLVSQSLAARRFAMILLAGFAALALLLSGIGIYGVISYVVGQRTHEIGIRMALGAQRSDVLKIVFGHAASLAAAGVVIGLASAAGLTRLMAKILYGVSASDPFTFVFVAVVLLCVALLACYVPARRAMRVDPVIALRYE